MSNQAEQSFDPWIFLLGRPPVEEYVSFVIQASPGQDTDIQALAEQWRSAAATVDQLALSESGVADNQTTTPLPDSLHQAAKKYMADPAVRASYALIPASIELVSLHDIVVFQKQINLRYARELQSLIKDPREINADLFKFCLTIDQPEPLISRMQTSANTFVFQSISTDARFLGASLVDASNLSGNVPAGKPHSAVVLYVGYGVNALNVLRINNRLVLNNGSHRAYALMAAGADHVPAVVQNITRDEELAIVPVVEQNKQLYLNHPRPPMLKDYFNDSLYRSIRAPRRSRQIRLQFGLDQLDAPG